MHVAINTVPMTKLTSMKTNPCARPQTSIIFEKGSMKRPDIKLEIIVVIAVKECSWKVLVMNGVKNLMMLFEKDCSKLISQILRLFVRALEERKRK